MNLLDSIFTVVVDTSWRSSWLIVAVLLLQWLFRNRLSARVQCWLTLALVLRLLVPYAIALGWSPLPAHLLSPPAAHDVAVLPSNLSFAPVAAAGDAPAPVTAAARAANSPARPMEVLAIAWALVAALLVIGRLLASITFAARVRRSGRAAPALVVAEVERQFGAGRVRVLITEFVAAPALHGVFHPRLLFPPKLVEQLSAGDLRLIIAHERGHHARRDALTQEVARLAAAIHWFNPLAWLAVRTLRRECELACDAHVLRGTSAEGSARYGETLLRILSLTHGARPPQVALGVVESKQQLKRRIQMIAHPAPASPLRTVLVCTAGLACAVASFTRSAQAQPGAAGSPESHPQRAIAPAAEPAELAAADNLDQLFPTGVVASMGDKTITVADVRREIAPLLPQIRHEAKTPQEFQQRLGMLQNTVIKDLIGRELLIKEFHAPAPGDPDRRIEPEWVDKAIADRIEQQFGGDREKFMTHLRDLGLTLADYRREVENDIIYSYMRAQERKLAPKPRANPPDHKGEVHLRLIQLPRNGQSDDALLKQADEVLARFHNGESFAELAKAVSADPRHTRGGDWGWVKESDVKAEYWASIRDLPKGQAAAPILLPEGAFLLYVEDRG